MTLLVQIIFGAVAIVLFAMLLVAVLGRRPAEPRRCRLCGCDEFHACLEQVTDEAGGTRACACSWIADDLCSACEQVHLLGRALHGIAGSHGMGLVEVRLARADGEVVKIEGARYAVAAAGEGR